MIAAVYFVLESLSNDSNAWAPLSELLSRYSSETKCVSKGKARITSLVKTLFIQKKDSSRKNMRT